MFTRPMLAATAESERDIRFPCAATPKLDGIRCLTLGGSAVARSFKGIRNRHAQALLAALPAGLDGELVCGDFNETQSAIMSYDGAPAFRYVVFDQWSLAGYWDRAHSLPALPEWCERLLPSAVYTAEELLAFEERCLEAGYEGVMTRHAHGPYLCKRATLRSQYLVKLKRMVTAEARVVGFTEGLTNCNALERDAFGYAERSGHAAGMIPRGTLGSLQCVDVASGAHVSIAGMTEALRAAIWANRAAYLGAVVTYKYQHQPGCAPRFPRLVGFRHEDDM